MVDIYIYSHLDLNDSRGSLEADIEDFLEGAGEISGGGSGERGWNVDVRLYSTQNLDANLRGLIVFLQLWRVPEDTFLDVWVRDKHRGKCLVFSDTLPDLSSTLRRRRT